MSDVDKPRTILHVRTNTNFAVNYGPGKIIPTTEIIILASKPRYKYQEDPEGIVREQEIEELRFLATGDEIEELINQLHQIKVNRKALDSVAETLNQMIVVKPTKEAGEKEGAEETTQEPPKTEESNGPTA